MTWHGVGPSGSFATLNTGGGTLRYDWEEGRGDVSGLVDSLIVIGLYGRSVAPTVPATSDVLTWNGAQWEPISLTLMSGAPHGLLSLTHPDTVPASPTDGDIIAGSGSPASWTRFPLGQPGQHLRVSTGGQLVWAFDPLTVVTLGSTVNLTSDSRRIIVNKTVGSSTAVNLPSSPFFGQEILVKDGKGDANINKITVYAPSGVTIDGFGSVIMKQKFQSYHFLFNGTDWNVI